MPPAHPLLPLEQIDERDDQHAYLVESGWAVDGKHLRWDGAGKRTLTQAVDEHRRRELAAAIATLRTCTDELLLRHACRHPALRRAALANPHVAPSLLDEAFGDGLYAAVAAAPAVTDAQLQAMAPTLLEAARGDCEQPQVAGWSNGVAAAVIANARLPLQARLELVATSFRWLRPNGPVEIATRAADPALLDAVVADLVERVAHTGQLERRRELIDLLVPAAINPATPVAALDAIAALEHIELDQALATNPHLPARLYRQLAALTDVRAFGRAELVAVATLERDEDYHPLTRAGYTGLKRLWLLGGERSELLKQPPGAWVDITELADGDLVLAPSGCRLLLEEQVGPSLWVPVRLPESPVAIHYRGWGHGATLEDALRYLRHVGRSLLADWAAIRAAHVAARPEDLLALAQRHRRHASEVTSVAAGLDAVRAGVPDRRVARALDLPVAELRARQHERDRSRPLYADGPPAASLHLEWAEVPYVQAGLRLRLAAGDQQTGVA